MFDPLTTGQYGGPSREEEAISLPVLLVLAALVTIVTFVQSIVERLRGR